MRGPPLGPGGEDITWPDQVAPRGQKASSTRKIKPQTSNPNRTITCGYCGKRRDEKDQCHTNCRESEEHGKAEEERKKQGGKGNADGEGRNQIPC